MSDSSTQTTGRKPFSLRIENVIFEIFVNISKVGLYPFGLQTSDIPLQKMSSRLGGFCQRVLNKRHL